MNLHLPLAVSSAVLALSLSASAVPAEAQAGRDLLTAAVPTAERAVRVGAARRADEERVAARVREVSSPGVGPSSVGQRATEVYQYDDDDLDLAFYLIDENTDEPLFEFEFAQRFDLSSEGTVEYAVACMARVAADTSSAADFALGFYGGGDGPGELLAAFDVPARLNEPGTYTCFQIAGAVEGLALEAGEVWVAVSWLRADPPENTKYLMADSNGPGGGARAFRARAAEGDDWEDWVADEDESTKAYGIRLAVDHPTAPPDPDPDPDPEEFTECVPTTAPLVFDGGYQVSMCWEASDGRVGDGKAGIWASSQSGLLWFFNRENAEVLIKVLDGCAINGHRWVFVAPVTDLAFNLHVVDRQDSSRRWTQRNPLGRTAPTRSDTMAFRCSE